MTKFLSIFFTCILYICGYTQPIVFPQSEATHYHCVDIEQDFHPTPQFLQSNPSFLSRGTYTIPKQPSFNATLYPATANRNEIPLHPPGKILFLFVGEEMADLDVSLTRKYLPSMGYCPLFCAKYIERYGDETKKVFSDEAISNIVNEVYAYKDQYTLMNSFYRETVFNKFSEKGLPDVTILPYASYKLSKQDIKPADLIFELCFDGYWCDIPEIGSYSSQTLNGKPLGIVKGSKIKGQPYECAGFFKLNIRDAAGKILKTYGQAVFVSIKPGSGYEYCNKLDALIMHHTYATAVAGLLGQYGADNDTRAAITKRTMALRIQATSDTSFIRLFKLKADAMEYRQCQLEILDELQEINTQIVNRGGSAIDISGVKVPQNTNPAISTANYNLAMSSVAAAAGLATAIANAANMAEVRKLQNEGEDIKHTFPKYAQLEEDAVNAYNNLIAHGKIHDANQIGNPGYTNSAPATSKANSLADANNTTTQSVANFWDEGKKSNNATSANNAPVVAASGYNNNMSPAPAPDQTPANTANFWDEGKAATPPPAANKVVVDQAVNLQAVSAPSVQAPAPSPSPVAISPIYHKVIAGETLYHLSMQYGVTIDDLKKWNDLSTGLNTGVFLVVGYVKNAEPENTIIPSVANNTPAAPVNIAPPSQTVPPTSGANNTTAGFWDDNQSAQSATANTGGSQTSSAPLQTLSSSPNLSNQLNDIYQTINQSTDNAKGALQSASSADLNWAQSKVNQFSPAQPVVQASTNGGNASGTDLASQCPEGVQKLKEIQFKTASCSSGVGMDMYCMNHIAAEVTQEALDLCRGKASPADIQELQTAIDMLNKQAEQFQNHGPQFNH